MTNATFDALFGGPPRQPEQLLDQRHMDLAASIQAVTEEVVLRLTRGAGRGDRREKSLPRGRRRAELRRQRQDLSRRQFRAASGSSRPLAMPAARSARPWPPITYLERAATHPVREPDAMQGAYLGPAYAQADIEHRLDAAGAKFHVVDDTALIAETADSAGGRQGGRLVPGPNGVRPSRAWRAARSSATRVRPACRRR